MKLAKNNYTRFNEPFNVALWKKKKLKKELKN